MQICFRSYVIKDAGLAGNGKISVTNRRTRCERWFKGRILNPFPSPPPTNLLSARRSLSQRHHLVLILECFLLKTVTAFQNWHKVVTLQWSTAVYGKQRFKIWALGCHLIMRWYGHFCPIEGLEGFPSEARALRTPKGAFSAWIRITPKWGHLSRLGVGYTILRAHDLASFACSLQASHLKITVCNMCQLSSVPRYL